jgi:hypothetical protein
MAGMGDVRRAEAPSRNLFDKPKFIAYLREHAENGGYGHGKCATKVREAIAHAGMSTVNNPVPAKDYGNFLMDRLFMKVSKQNYIARPGDVVVFNIPPSNHPYGHIQVFDGHLWLSDHYQRQGFYPHHDYKQSGVNYEIYRRP